MWKPLAWYSLRVTLFVRPLHNPMTLCTFSLSQINYKMAGMHPSDWDNLVSRFDKDDQLFQEFYLNYVKHVKTSKCTGNCKGSLLCEMVTSRSGDTSKCHFSQWECSWWSIHCFFFYILSIHFRHLPYLPSSLSWSILPFKCLLHHLLVNLRMRIIYILSRSWPWVV